MKAVKLSRRSVAASLLTIGILGGGTAAWAVTVPNPDPCDAFYNKPKVGEVDRLRNYMDCRLDRVEKSIPTVAPAVTVTGPTVTVPGPTTTVTGPTTTVPGPTTTVPGPTVTVTGRCSPVSDPSAKAPIVKWWWTEDMPWQPMAVHIETGDEGCGNAVFTTVNGLIHAQIANDLPACAKPNEPYANRQEACVLIPTVTDMIIIPTHGSDPLDYPSGDLTIVVTNASGLSTTLTVPNASWGAQHTAGTQS